jgi:hypothetical protein
MLQPGHASVPASPWERRYPAGIGESTIRQTQAGRIPELPGYSSFPNSPANSAIFASM